MHPLALDPADDDGDDDDDDNDDDNEEEEDDILEVCQRGREGRFRREHSRVGTLAQTGLPPW